MKLLKSSFASRVRSYVGTLVVTLLVGSVVQSQAQIYVTSTANGVTYKAAYDTTQNAFTEWSANGVNQLNLQSLYYSINGGSLTQLTGGTVSTSGFGSFQKITVDYTVSEGTIQAILTLSGNTLGESIKFSNSSGSSVDMGLFQYSDFVLGGPAYAGNQTVNMTPASSGGSSAAANQTGGGLMMGWQAQVAGFTTLVQASDTGAPFGAFLGSGNLDNTTLSENNTYAVFGFEFTGTVANGNSLTVSENSAFPIPVPEPSALALISAGTLAAALMLWRRRDKGFHLQNVQSRSVKKA